MCPNRYILLNFNHSDFYAFTKGVSTYLIGLGYYDLSSKDGMNWISNPRKNVLGNSQQ